MNPKFFICKHCGNVITHAYASGATVSCCGEEMLELIPNTVDAAKEKHVPVIEKIDCCTVKVKVGEAEHPMTEKHYISWIALDTGKNLLLRQLTPSDAPEAVFAVAEGDALTAYAYCNLHQLWKN